MFSLTLSPQAGERIWIAVADGSRANVFEPTRVNRSAPAQGSGRDPSEDHNFTLTAVSGFEMHATPLEAYDLGRHPPAQKPRGMKQATPMSGGEPKKTTQDQIRKDFAQQIADTLNQACDQKQFTKLVLIASPAVLGQIKSGLNRKALDHLVAAHSADLTHFSGPELFKRVNHLLQPEKMAS